MKPDKRALELASSSFEIDSQSSGKNFFAIANKLELNRSNPMKVCTNVLQIYNRKIVQFYFSGNKNPRVFLQFLLGEYFGLFRTNKARLLEIEGYAMSAVSGSWLGVTSFEDESN
jgi:hypothetical protein